MLTAEAVIATEHPDQYLVRLGKHAAKMGSGLGHRPRAHGGQPPPQVEHAECSATSGTVRLSSGGGWTMQAAPGALRRRAQAADQASLRQIQDMLTTRLERFGRREHLTVTWQPAGTPAAEHGQAE
jgi:hypothetical protein